MTAPIEDVSSLPGKKISDQAETPIGEVKEIYATDGYPMWVAVELSSGIAEKRMVLIPLARIKDEDGELRVPYSKQRIGEAPEVDTGDGISAECDRQLRDYYGIDTGDQELRGDNKSYATLVPEEPGEAERVDNPDELETPDADTRTDESRERLRDPGSSEMRKVTAEDVAHDTQGSKDDSSGDDGSSDRDEDSSERDEDSSDRDESDDRDEDSEEREEDSDKHEDSDERDEDSSDQDHEEDEEKAESSRAQRSA